MKIKTVDQSLLLGGYMLKNVRCLFTFNSFIIFFFKEWKNTLIGAYRWFLLPAGQVCLHPLLCREVRSRFISWGPLLIHIWSLPSNPATSVVEQHQSECNSISEWTEWIMLIVVSIASCVYPPASMKPSRLLCIRSLLFSLWTLPSPMISLQAMHELQFV